MRLHAALPAVGGRHGLGLLALLHLGRHGGDLSLGLPWDSPKEEGLGVAWQLMMLLLR